MTRNPMPLCDIARKLGKMQIARKTGRAPNPEAFEALLASGKIAIAKARDVPLNTAVLSLTPELIAQLPEKKPSHSMTSYELENIRPWLDSDLLILAQSRGLQLAPVIRNLLSPPCLQGAVRAAAAEKPLTSEICDSSMSLVASPSIHGVADLLRVQVDLFTQDMNQVASAFLYQNNIAYFVAMMLAGVKSDNPHLDFAATNLSTPIGTMLRNIRSAHGRMRLQKFGPLEAFLADWPRRLGPFREEFGLHS